MHIRSISLLKYETIYVEYFVDKKEASSFIWGYGFIILYWQIKGVGVGKKWPDDWNNWPCKIMYKSTQNYSHILKKTHTFNCNNFTPIRLFLISISHPFAWSTQIINPCVGAQFRYTSSQLLLLSTTYSFLPFHFNRLVFFVRPFYLPDPFPFKIYFIRPLTLCPFIIILLHVL